MSESVQEIVSVADVADGNPSAAWSIAEQLRMRGGDPIEILLSATSVPVNFFHKRVREDHNEAKDYTEGTEKTN